FEPDDRDELDKSLRQALYHLDEIGIAVPSARSLLLSALKTHRQNGELSAEQRRKFVNSVAKAKNAIGDKITSFQPGFSGYPTIEQLSRIDQQVRDALASSSTTS